jgi:hypothetical protein
MRSSDLIDQPAYDRAGTYVGRVVDVVVEPGPDGLPRVAGVLVSRGWHGRLLGYERAEAHGPWLLERLARLIRRGNRTLDWTEVRVGRRVNPSG